MNSGPVLVGPDPWTWAKMLWLGIFCSSLLSPRPSVPMQYNALVLRPLPVLVPFLPSEGLPGLRGC